MVSQLKDGQATSEQLFPAVEAPEEAPKEGGKPKKTGSAKGEAPKATASLLCAPPHAATPEQLEAIRLGCLEKGIDLELILEKWQVSQLEELDEDQAQQIQEWLKRQ
jgi:hypothetical protein